MLLYWSFKNEADWLRWICENWRIKKRNNPEEQGEYDINNASDTEKYGAVSAKVITDQG